MSGTHQQLRRATAEMDDQDPRVMRRVTVSGTSISIEIMVHRADITDRKPLVIVNSIDLPMPPSHAFCEQMWAAGYQVIFVRRPGFGETPDLPNILLSKQEVEKQAPVAAETVLLKVLVEQLELKEITLMGLGTANSVCMRLAQICPDVQFTVFANPLFNSAIWDVIRPPWLKRMIRQTLLSRSGLKIAVRGLKAVLRRDALWFYTQFAQKSHGDQAYIETNKSDFRRAGLSLQGISPDTFFYDLQTALIADTEWNPEVTSGLNAVILSGEESTTRWKQTIRTEAARLDLPIIFAPSGDLFVPYASPDVLLTVLKTQEAERSATAP